MKWYIQTTVHLLRDFDFYHPAAASFQLWEPLYKRTVVFSTEKFICFVFWIFPGSQHLITKMCHAAKLCDSLMHRGMLPTENVNNLCCIFFHLKNLQIFANNGFPFFLLQNNVCIISNYKKSDCISILVSVKLNSSCTLILLYNIFFFSVIKAIICFLWGVKEGFVYQTSQAAAFSCSFWLLTRLLETKMTVSLPSCVRCNFWSWIQRFMVHFRYQQELLPRACHYILRVPQ